MTEYILLNQFSIQETHVWYELLKFYKQQVVAATNALFEAKKTSSKR